MFKGSYDLIKAIIEKVQLPADLKMLLIAIANHWSKYNPNPFPEYTTLVAEAGIPKRTLPRKLKALKEAGWLEWEHGRGRSNIYTLAVEKIEALSATVALPEMARPDLALPDEEVAPKLGTRVAPKLGTLTNKKQTIYNKQRVEPNKQAVAIIQSLPAEEVSPENEMVQFTEDGKAYMVFDLSNLLPATRGSFPSTNPSLLAAVEVQAPPPPPPPVAPPPQQAKKPRFMVKPFYNHPGNWVIADTVLHGLVEEADDRRPKTFTDETAAQTEAQELEKAA